MSSRPGGCAGAEALKVAVVSMAPPFGSSHAVTGPLGSPHGYAIYVYRQGQWALEADLSATGCEPSSPGLPGSYEGQVVKKESQPVRSS